MTVLQKVWKFLLASSVAGSYNQLTQCFNKVLKGVLVLVTDINMFHQVMINRVSRYYCKFLWWPKVTYQRMLKFDEWLSTFFGLHYPTDVLCLV